MPISSWHLGVTYSLQVKTEKVQVTQLPHFCVLVVQDYKADERQKLAAKSRLEAPKFGSADRQRIVDGIHSRMLAAKVGPCTLSFFALSLLLSLSLSGASKARAGGPPGGNLG